MAESLTSSALRFLGDVRVAVGAVGELTKVGVAWVFCVTFLDARRLRNAPSSAPIVFICSPIVFSTTACTTSWMLMLATAAPADASSPGSGILARPGSFRRLFPLFSSSSDDPSSSSGGSSLVRSPYGRVSSDASGS